VVAAALATLRASGLVEMVEDKQRLVGAAALIRFTYSENLPAVWLEHGPVTGVRGWRPVDDGTLLEVVELPDGLLDFNLRKPDAVVAEIIDALMPGGEAPSVDDSSATTFDLTDEEEAQAFVARISASGEPYSLVWSTPSNADEDPLVRGVLRDVGALFVSPGDEQHPSVVAWTHSGRDTAELSRPDPDLLRARLLDLLTSSTAAGPS